MGKKGQSSTNLGRSIIRDRFGKKNKSGHSMLHTSEINDGQDWNRINFQSITEQTTVDDFLATAELAGTEFQAEKLNMNFVRATSVKGVLTAEEQCRVEQAQAANQQLLSIPRRPGWDLTTTPEQLAEAERSSFLAWRRSLAQLQEVEGITLTPYERNLEFWRQLWRVIERSDVVVQILDARNPLLFRCEDLEAYVKEVDPNKDNLLLINKSDFLTETQREMWAKYFQESGIKAIFFSAALSSQLADVAEEEESDTDSAATPEEHHSTDCVEQCRQDLESLSAQQKDTTAEGVRNSEAAGDTSPAQSSPATPTTTIRQFVPTSTLLSRTELIEAFGSIHCGRKVLGSRVTVGLVGYPNVGKSSTINCLLQEKKVSVSATPGKTKHFQTLNLTKDVVLCDCPGLVFPAFVATKAEMIVSGILPIDQMRDEVGPINVVASRIPRPVLEATYTISLPQPLEGEDPHRPPTSEELLNAYGFMRGFMTQRGLPDNPRSARYILKDYMTGRLLYCHAPPGTPQQQYHTFTNPQDKRLKGHVQPTPQQLAAQPHRVRPDMLDKKFFSTSVPQCHIKGINTGGLVRIQSGRASSDQPRQKNFKKREKLRRRFAHLDQ